MVKRNRELNEEAIRLLQMEEQGITDEKVFQESAILDGEMKEAKLQREQAEMEEAIAMSLAAEEEQIRLMKDEEE